MKVLFAVNGGLGDAAEITRTVQAAKALGHDAWACAWRGQAELMVPLWKAAGYQCIDRHAAKQQAWDAVCCATDAGTLASRFEGWDARLRVNGEPRADRHMCENNRALLIALGHTAEEIARVEDPTPLAKLLPRGVKRDVVAIAPGVGKAHNPEQARGKDGKKYRRWPQLLTYLPRAVLVLGHPGCWSEPVQDGVEDWTSRTPNVTDLVQLFARVRCLWAVDNGLHHLARLLGVPTVSIWTGETTPELFNAPGAVAVEASLPPGQIANVLHYVEHPECTTAVHPKPGKLLSVVITAHNEGDEVLATIEDVRRMTGCRCEFVVVDEASTDESCRNLGADVRVVRHGEMRGVAPARNVGAREAQGDAMLFLDSHMRLAPGTGAMLLEQALERPCIAMAPMAPLYSTRSQSYGERWIFKERLRAEWMMSRRPDSPVVEVPCFRAPGWCISRETWQRIGPWPASLAGWGSTEVTMALRANLTGTPVLVLRDALCWHRFRSRFPYPVNVYKITQNAVVAAVTSFGREWYEKHLKPRMQPHYWCAAAEDLPPKLEREAAAFARIRTVSPDDWARQNLPELLK
jgi:GT2 family glycosyltransferase